MTDRFSLLWSKVTGLMENSLTRKKPSPPPEGGGGGDFHADPDVTVPDWSMTVRVLSLDGG